MDDLPIPRSNIYKSIALSGVAVIIVTLVFLGLRIPEIDNQVLEAEERADIMTARLDADESTQGEKPRPALEQTLDRIRLESTRKRLEVLERSAAEMREWGLILVTIGVVLAAFGFSYWYRKIQLPMELIAQHRAQEYVAKARTE